MKTNFENFENEDPLGPARGFVWGSALSAVLWLIIVLVGMWWIGKLP